MFEIPDSARLSFHFVTAQDADFLFQLDQDPEVMRFLNGGKPTPRDDIDNVFLPRLNAYAYRERGWGLWKACLKDTAKTPIGWILVRPYGYFTDSAEMDNLELGWRFMREYWGKGLASEAAERVRDTLFESGVQVFSAIAMPDNLASIGIMKKLGMEFDHFQHYQDAVFDEQVVVYKQSFE